MTPDILTTLINNKFGQPQATLSDVRRLFYFSRYDELTKFKQSTNFYDKPMEIFVGSSKTEQFRMVLGLSFHELVPR